MPPTETLAPDAIVSSTNLSGAVTDIDELVDAPYAPNAVLFDGTSTYLTHDSALTNAVNGELFTCALAFRRPALNGAGVFRRLFGGQATTTGTTRWALTLTPSDDATQADGLIFELRNDIGTNICVFYSDLAMTDLDTYYTILISLDLNDTAKRHLYINDAAHLGAVTTYVGTSTAVFETPANRVGVLIQAGGPTQHFYGQMADLWIEFGRYVDFSVESNRRKFFTANGAVVDKSANGSAPFDAVPHMFFAGTTDGWHTNKGGGGGFTETGALTDGTPPAGGV